MGRSSRVSGDLVPGRASAARLDVAARIAAAVLGGYVVAALGAAWMGRALPLERNEATVLATLLSFVVYTAAVLWAFTARSAIAAWLGLLVTGAALGIGLALA